MLEDEAKSGNKNIPADMLPELKDLNTSSIQRMMEKCEENFNTFTLQRVSVHFANQNNGSDDSKNYHSAVLSDGLKPSASEDDDGIILTELDNASVQEFQESRRISASKNYITKESEDIEFDGQLTEFPELVSTGEQRAKNIVKRQSYIKLREQPKEINRDSFEKPHKVFLLIYDDFNVDIFDKFENNYSQTEHIDSDYNKNTKEENSNFIITFRLSGTDNTPILKRKTSEAWEDDIDFMRISNFQEDRFKKYKNLYSSEYKFQKETRDKSPMRKKWR